ncbi:MAG: VOC family protein [Pseudomonadales bacterium]|nr:VOC family protein [Pseudomonadales bacterium]MCP5171260.1 VOC family protein [Pseudomonadales bacterium]
MSVRPIPEGYHAITPYLSISGAAEAIEFYKCALGAEELFRLAAPNGDIMHAEIKIGDSAIMLAESCEESGFRNPKKLEGTSVGIHLYVENVDEIFSRAIEAGAKVVKPVENQFYGDRNGTVEDPFGHLWFIATHIEDLNPEEISARAKALYEQGGK